MPKRHRLACVVSINAGLHVGEIVMVWGHSATNANSGALA